MKKLIDILKAAGEYCTIGAGVATILISVVAAFVALPVFVTFVVAAGVGLICAGIGAYQESRHLRLAALQNKKKTNRQQDIYKEIKHELDEIKHDLEAHHETKATQTDSISPQTLRIHFFSEPEQPLNKQAPSNEPVFSEKPSRGFPLAN